MAWLNKAWHDAKQRARRKDLSFDITLADLEAQYQAQNGKCYWFGVPFVLDSGQAYHPASPSLDRVSSHGGYTYGNVVWACLAANSAKRDTEPLYWEEFLEALRYTMREKVE